MMAGFRGAVALVTAFTAACGAAPPSPTITAPTPTAPPVANLEAPPTTAPAPSELPSPPRCEPSPRAASNHPCLVQTVVQLPSDGALIPFGDGSEGEVTWKGRLDADDRDDLILLFHGTAGNWGEILYSAYVGCGGGGYAPVFGPDYALELVPAEPDSSGHRRLRWVVRNESHAHPDTVTTELRFDASGCYAPR